MRDTEPGPGPAPHEPAPHEPAPHEPASRELAELCNEFASVRISLDERGNGPRLLVQDLENGMRIWLSPLELASLCLATPEDRVDWLRVGHYREDRR
ncbi:MAG: hypothetical protein QOE54_5576 [Streptosporangiaceae bacterium]|nr:hypothetical protein [Streptosporangiaceae bacterium]